MSAEDLAFARRLLLEAPDEPAADLLYSRWFHRQGDDLREYPAGGAYRAVSLDPTRFMAGWTVIETLPGRAGAVVAERNGERREACPPACVPAERGRLRLAAGHSLLVDPLTSGVTGGFWHLWSDAWRRGTPERLQRLYLAIVPGSELEAARRIARLADPIENWALKLLTGIHPTGRSDPAVLYLERSRPLDTGWVGALPGSLAGLLGSARPPFTRGVAQGIAWAEDPGGGLSFGQHLCRLLAAAAQAPHALQGEHSWRDAAAREFRAAGLATALPGIFAASGADRDA